MVQNLVRSCICVSLVANALAVFIARSVPKPHSAAFFADYHHFPQPPLKKQSVHDTVSTKRKRWINACEENRSRDDMEKPIRQVLNGQNGFCFFGSQGLWLRSCASAHERKDYFTYAKARTNRYDQITSMEMFGPPMVVRYAEGTRILITNNRKFPLEDVYCEANGWMNLPLQDILNQSALERMAKKECDDLMAKFTKYWDTSFDDMRALSRIEADMLRNSSVAGGNGPTETDVKRIALAKCLLGGLECDIANCALNFCQPGNHGTVYHGHQCRLTHG